MSKPTNYCSVILSTLLFSGVAIAHGVPGEIETDMIYGHSADHKDQALVNSSPSQAPDNHAHGEDGSDLIHQMTVDKMKLNPSPSSSPEVSKADNHDDNTDLLHR